MMHQDEAQRWLGAFAFGNDDEDMSSGELNYHPRDGIFVRVLNWTGSKPRVPRDAGSEYPALKGVIEGTRRCTVLHAFETSVDGGRYELSRTVGNAILLDGLCDDPAAPAFRRMRFRSPAFTAITNPHGIKVDRHKRKVKVVAEPRKAVEATWGPHKLILASVLNVGGMQASDGTLSLAERPYLEIQFAKAVSFDEIMRIIGALEFFACLGAGAFSGPPEVSLWLDPAPPMLKKGQQPPVLPTEGKLLLSQSWYRKTDAKPPFRRTILLDELAPAPLDFLARWLDLSTKMGRLMSLYQAASEAPTVETRFLFLIQAVEGLHRTLDHRPGIDQGEFDRGVAAVSAALPNDLSSAARTFLKERLPRHNEPSLNGRLKEYGGRVTTVLPAALPGFSKDRRGIKDLRDEFSHALPMGQEIDLGEYGCKLLYYSEVLRLLFEFNLLHHLNLHQTQLKRAFGRIGAFEKLARERSELRPEKPADKSGSGRTSKSKNDQSGAMDLGQGKTRKN